jgi:dTDP-4-dehydrorhamnose reductase
MLASAYRVPITISVRHTVIGPTHSELDILNRAAVADVLDSSSPWYSFFINGSHGMGRTAWPRTILSPPSGSTAGRPATSPLACDRAGAVLVYISSCGYCGDEKKYYSEYDPVVLKTVYARSKHQGEIYGACRPAGKRFAIRPGWLSEAAYHTRKISCTSVIAKRCRNRSAVGGR